MSPPAKPSTSQLHDTPTEHDPFDLLFQNHPLPMWFHDIGTLEFFDVNAAAIKSYGYSREEFLKMKVTELRDAKAPEKEPGGKMGSWAGFHPLAEERHQLADGRLLDVEVSLHEVEFHGKQAVLAVVFDVNERNRLQSELKEQKDFLELVTAMSSHLTYIYQVSNGEEVYGSRNIAWDLGYSFTEAQAMTKISLANLVDPRDQVKLEALRAKWKDSTENLSHSIKIRVRHRSGRMRWYNIQERAFSWSHDKQVERVIGVAEDITAQEEAAEELRERRREFESLAQNLPDLICRCDADFRTLYVNEVWEKVSGLPKAFYRGKLLDKLGLPASFVQPWKDAVSKAVRTKTIQTADLHLARSSKDTRTFEARVVPELRASGAVGSVLTVARDITDRLHAQQEAAAAGQLLASTVERMKRGFLALDSELCLTYANAAAAAFFQASEAMDLIGKPIRDPFAAVKASACYLDCCKSLQNQESRTLEHVCPLGRGWFEFRILPSADGLIVFISDIAERKQAEEEFRQLAERQGHLLASSPCVIYELEMRGNQPVPVWISENISRVLGITAQQALQRGWWQSRIHPDDQETVEKGIRGLVSASARHLALDYRLLQDDDTILWIHDELQVVFNRATGNTTLVGSWLNVTETKQMEIDLGKIREQYYQAQKIESVGRLAGGIAHDLNNMLVPILYNAEAASQNVAPGSELESALQQIQQAAQRSADLVKQILTYSRPATLEVASSDLNGLVNEYTSMLRRTIGEDIELRHLLSPSLPPIRCAHVQIGQVLMNLAVNARDAMPEGGLLTLETREVQLTRDYTRKQINLKPGTYVVLSVADTGFGMDEATRQRMFDPFFTTKEQGKGTGLGLATVQAIVAQHQGHIEVESFPGKSTRFDIFFPAEPRNGKAKPQPARPQGKPTAPNGCEILLVVEDEEMVRRSICRALRAKSYNVLEAESPRAALDLIRQLPEPPDLLVTDVIMPQMNGRQLYDKLSQKYPNLKVLFMSGYARDITLDFRDAGKQAPFLQKPFGSREVLEKVREVLDTDA